MKCIPQTRSGRPVAAARRPIGIDEVLEARIAPGFERGVELPEERQLELDVLARGLDRELRIRRGRELGRGRDAREHARPGRRTGPSRRAWRASAPMPAERRARAAPPPRRRASRACRRPRPPARCRRPSDRRRRPRRARSRRRRPRSRSRRPARRPSRSRRGRARRRAGAARTRASRRAARPRRRPGWPSATAPPLTLTRSASTPRSRDDCTATDANASLISITSMSAAVRPGALERDLRGLGRHARERVVAVGRAAGREDARERLEPALAGELGVGDDEHRGAVVDARRVAGRVRRVLGVERRAARRGARASCRGAAPRRCRRASGRRARAPRRPRSPRPCARRRSRRSRARASAAPTRRGRRASSPSSSATALACSYISLPLQGSRRPSWRFASISSPSPKR